MKTSTLDRFRQALRIALVAVTTVFLSLLVLIYLKFGEALIGKIAVTSDTQILATIDLSKLEKLESRQQERLNKPYLPEIRNPFVATTKPPPALVP